MHGKPGKKFDLVTDHAQNELSFLNKKGKNQLKKVHILQATFLEKCIMLKILLKLKLH